MKLLRAITIAPCMLGILLVTGAVLTHSQARAQGQAVIPEAPVTEDADKAKNSSAKSVTEVELSKQELDAGLPVLIEINRLESEKQAGLQKVFTATSEDSILAGARQWREAMKDQQVMFGRRDQWIGELAKSHHCVGCTMIDFNDREHPKLLKPSAQAKPAK